MPTQTNEHVRWVSGTPIVASGEDRAWVVDVESAAPKAVKASDGRTGAEEDIDLDPAQGATLTSWKLEGLKKKTTGQTLSTSLTASTAVTLDNFGGLPAKQGVLTLSLADPGPPDCSCWAMLQTARRAAARWWVS